VAIERINAVFFSDEWSLSAPKPIVRLLLVRRFPSRREMYPSHRVQPIHRGNPFGSPEHPVRTRARPRAAGQAARLALSVRNSSRGWCASPAIVAPRERHCEGGRQLEPCLVRVNRAENERWNIFGAFRRSMPSARAPAVRAHPPILRTAAERLERCRVPFRHHEACPRTASEKDAKLAQKLGQLQPFIAAFPPECMGQLTYFGPT
jgi:hypothetical protein